MSYYEIEQPVEGFVEVKKSKFYTHLVPYPSFEHELAAMKDRYPKANHFVYAYRYLNEFDQIVENQSDDGEPKGSSGKPTLGVLAGNHLVNTAVITARLFGGTKLGVGGLVRAYGDSVKHAISLAKLVAYRKLVEMKLECSYAALSQLQRILKSFDSEIVTKEFQAETVSHVVKIQDEYVLDLTKEIGDLDPRDCKVLK